MTILLKLIPLIKKLDNRASLMYLKTSSWVFFNIRGGYKCSICGAKHMHFRGDAEGKVTHINGSEQRMMLSFSGQDGETVCPDCVLDAIDDVFIKGMHTQIGKCDFTGKENVPVINCIWNNYNIFNINVRFGREWWNGFSASKEALVEAITSCEMKSSMITYKNGKSFYNSGKYIVSKPQTYDELSKKNFN